MVTEKMIEMLKPCPFCGGKPNDEIESNGMGSYWIVCDNTRDACGCEGPYRQSEEDAVSAWNRRAEAALSTGAEPVAWLVKRSNFDGVLFSTELSFTRPTMSSTCKTEMVPLNAAPPAPSVAVKALKAAEEELSRIDCIPMVTETKGPYDQLELAKVYAGRGAHQARKALSALSAQVQDVAGWQDFSTVPKDGTVVDLWHEEFGRFPDCYWGKSTHECGEAGRYCDSDWHSEAEGWVSSTFNSSIFSDGWTHWMKPAAAPAAKQEGKP